MSETIISLCYVNKQNEKSFELCRIADLIEDEFVPYFFNGTDFYDTDRDLVYGSQNDCQPQLGTIGVFEWSTYINSSNEWRTKAVMSEQRSWYEVIMTKYDTMEKLVNTVKKGYPMDAYDQIHDLILCCKTPGHVYDAIYISHSDAYYRDGNLQIKGSVNTLPRVQITNTHINDCQYRYSQYDTRKFLDSDKNCRTVGVITLRTKKEIISDLIKNSLTKDVLSRRERQTARIALDKLIIPTIAERAADSLNCSVPTAKGYIKEYIEAVQKRLDDDTSVTMIELLIENDSDSVKRMRETIQREWNETQQEQKEKARRIQEEQQKALIQIKKDISTEESKLIEMRQKLAEAEASTAETIALQDQIEKEIQSRLAEFKSNYASLLVENVISASVLPVQYTDSINIKTDQSKMKISIPDNSVEEDSLEENLDVAIENWEEVCSRKEMAKGLAVLTFAAYALSIPLLVTGFGAVEISDLLSASICGQPAIRLYIDENEVDMEYIVAEINKAPDAVVCVINGLKAGYDNLRLLMQMCPHRLFIVTELHAETLIMEPASLFSVFIPVFCDYFYTGHSIEELPIYNCCKELKEIVDQITVKKLKEARALVSQWFNDGFYAPAIREKCAYLISAMNILLHILDGKSSDIEVLTAEFLFTPLMMCLKKQETLLDHLKVFAMMDNESKDNLISFIEMEN